MFLHHPFIAAAPYTPEKVAHTPPPAQETPGSLPADVRPGGIEGQSWHAKPTIEVPETSVGTAAPETPGITFQAPRAPVSPASITSENAPEGGTSEIEIGSPLAEPVQGERVTVERLEGPGEAAREAVGEGEGIPTVDVRPEHEVEVISAAGAASAKASEAALVAAQRKQELEAKQQELEGLRAQAETLELDAEGFKAQASLEKIKADQARERVGEIEREEAARYEAAAAAERERREVVARARPLAAEAYEKELEAQRVKESAADTEYHAQVLEARSKALLRESEQLTEAARGRLAEADLFAAELTVVKQEHAEIVEHMKSIHASAGLPKLIEKNNREIGVLAARIKKLREEIEWAENEIVKVRADADDWARIAARKKSETSVLLLKIAEAREAADVARERAREAAEEARQPSELSEVKYREAARLAKQAEELEAEAKSLQEEALAIVGEAQAPVAVRQEKLREAAELEAQAKALEAHAALVGGRVDRRLYESRVRAETAELQKEKAQELVKEVERAQVEVDTHEEIAQDLQAEAERHAGKGPLAVAAEA